MAERRAARRAPAARANATSEEDVPLPELQDGAPMQIGDRDADEVPRATVQKKLTLLLTDADDLEVDRMQPQTRAKLIAGIKRNPGLMRELAGDGSSAAPGAPADDLMNAEMVSLLYGVIGQIGVAVARGFATKESAERMQFTDDDKKLLTDPTLAVLRKYPIISGKWKEEIVLGSLLTVIVYSKVQQLDMIKKPAAVVNFPQAGAEAPATE